ncbi:MAG: (2Fe-2S)-binding protein [Halobacteriovoraceae bacterium]|nr:(2Fe-2S)-binding protein [Halobacteriovoraceae bacterium]|tara:strand:+ start:21315 stop:21524 length:210 start_codon:yes stop_codon:yes gene_type:complete
MYVCICKAITDKQIEEATKTSANFNEACKKLGLGSECGVCLQDAINSYRQNHKQQHKAQDSSKIKKSPV